MADVFTPQKRSEFMSAVRTTGTRPEQVIARALFARGFRYRIGVKALPGKPDLVFPKWNSVILVHGCFWHGHDCHLFKWPKTRVEFWETKSTATRPVIPDNVSSCGSWAGACALSGNVLRD